MSDENGRKRELAQELLQLRPNGAFRMSVECGKRLVEQDHARRARQRTSQGDALALTTGKCLRIRSREVRDPKPLEVLVRTFLGPVRDVLAHGEMGKERVLLEHEPDPALVGPPEEPALRVEPDVVAQPDPAEARPHESSDRAQHRGLAGP